MPKLTESHPDVPIDRRSRPASAGDNYSGVWGHRVGFGKRAAVLAVDFVQAYTLPDSPLYAAGVVPAVIHARDVLAQARRARMTVIHTTITYHSATLADAGAWYRKAPVLACFTKEPYRRSCEGVEPVEGELVVHKQFASAFFGTCLAGSLVAAGVDTLIILGCSTSGCVRATAVDGVQHGFNVAVVRECVGDRHPDPHEASLFDIDSKYGDVVSKLEAIEYIRGAGQPSVTP